MSGSGKFFGLVLILSLPFYAIGATGLALPFAAALPLSALMAIVPMTAALILVLGQGGIPATRAFLARAFDCRRGKAATWIIATTLMPAAFAVTSGLIWLSGTPLPPLHLLPLGTIVPAFAIFFMGAVGEELGWQSYAFPALTKHYSALTAALIIGVVWALWHVIPFALMGRGAMWIAWQSLGMVCMRVIIVWLVTSVRQSIGVAVLFHMMSNSVWGMFADFDPYYSPAVLCLVLLAPVIFIVTNSGPTTLGRFRYDQPSTPRSLS